MHYGIGIGSKTSTGGEVTEGNSSVIFDGMVASSIGHMATCKACSKGSGPIVGVGKRDCILPAGPAARAGDYVACGCPPGANVLLPMGTIQIGAHGAMGSSAMRSSSFAAPSESSVVEQGNAELAESLEGAMWPPYNPMTGEDLTNKLRAVLEANHKKAIILTPEDAMATLKDMWKEKGTDALNTANSTKDLGDYGMTIYKSYELVKQFGDLGVKAEVFKSNGKEYIAITTKNNSSKVLRHVLVNEVRLKINGHKYRINNPKISQLGLSPQSRASGFKGGAAVTFVISAGINTNELIFNDQFYLVDWFGNVGADMFKALIQFGAGEAVLLLAGTLGAPILVGTVLVIMAYVAIDLAFEKWEVSEKVVGALNSATT